MKKSLIIEIIFVFIILVLGLFLRLYNLEAKTGFDADQEWMVTRASEVLKGDLPLVGPITSVGAFSIGPGFVYLSTIFVFLYQGDPVSLPILSVSLGILTLLSIYLFLRFFVNTKVAFLTLILMTFSFNLITWDQNPWTPSLFYFSQILLLTGAYLVNKKEIGYIFLALGIVSGFQAHLGVVLSIISILIYFMFIRPMRPKIKILSISLLILFIGFLPNIVFDLRNSFVNTGRLIEAIKGEEFDYFLGFGKIVDTLSYNAVSHFYPQKNSLIDNVVIKTLFALIVVSSLVSLRNKKERDLSFLLLLTTFVPSLMFYLQQGKFSEYYLMMTVPSLIFMGSLLLNKVIEKKFLIVLIVSISIYFNFLKWYEFERNWSLKSKKEVVEEIIKKGGKENYGISLTTKHGDQYGFKYMFDYYGIKADIPPKKGETKIFTIVIPEGFDGIYGLKDFGGIGLIWQGI